jgi:hypothetical protein
VVKLSSGSGNQAAFLPLQAKRCLAATNPLQRQSSLTVGFRFGFGMNAACVKSAQSNLQKRRLPQEGDAALPAVMQMRPQASFSRGGADR